MTTCNLIVIMSNHNMAIIKQRTQHLRKIGVEDNRITTVSLEKQGCREIPRKACGNQGCASVSATWHFIFNTDTSRSISIPTEIFFGEPRLIYINGVLASHDFLLVKLTEIGFSFYGALFFVSLRLFFRVMLSFVKA